MTNKLIGLEVSSPYWEKGTVIAVNNGQAWVEVHRVGINDMVTVDVSELKKLVPKPTLDQLVEIIEDDTMTYMERACDIMQIYEEYYEG